MAEAVAVYVPVDRLTDFMIDALIKMGVPRADAGISADVLLAADLKGVRSHGVAHLKWYHQRIKTGLQQPETSFVNCEPTAKRRAKRGFIRQERRPTTTRCAPYRKA